MSVSIASDDLALLKRYAREAHDGNLSAAFAEAARLVRQRQARKQLITALGGPTLTDASRAAIDAEQKNTPRQEPARGRKRGAA